MGADAASQPAMREVISFRTLKAAFPDKIGDLVRNSNTGQTATVGDLTTSTATANYAADAEGKEPTIEITVLDYNNPAMAVGMSMGVKMNISTETDDEITKTMKIDGQPAMMQFNFKDKHGSYTILIADRLLFTVNVQGMAEADFKKVPEKLPVKAFADLCK
jgi:hypothetical protein